MPDPNTPGDEVDRVREQADEALAAVAELHRLATATILLSPDTTGEPEAPVTDIGY
ncbi:hypothetical protein [Amycolatopsis minnesotensis]|uniref:Uncharacterized protein n=1 Tax=Amycolatopsis minnesotensis TaxID=337894 RepID=A0ABP5DDE2_9PSEU